ncbi:hypothetical protein [Staphylococcus epidermidis]|nr:hypothetical protein [Staphylococcus epidermidis]
MGEGWKVESELKGEMDEDEGDKVYSGWKKGVKGSEEFKLED